MITRLGHVCLTCRNLKKTKYFYTKILKLKVSHVFKTKKNGVYGYIFAAGKTTSIEVFKKPNPKKRFNRFKHLCFHVKALKPVTTLFQKKQIKSTITIGKTDEIPQC